MHLVLLVSLLIFTSERDTPTYTQGSEDQSDGMNENVDFVLHSLDMVWNGMFSTIKNKNKSSNAGRRQNQWYKSISSGLYIHCTLSRNCIK